MITKLYNYLHDFMLHNNWVDNKNVSEQARAIFTTICMLDNIEADTAKADIMLMNLYTDSHLGELDISLDEFENFMYDFIV